MQRPRWSLRRARALVGTKFQLIAGLVGFVLVAWLVELVAGIRAVSLGPILAAVMAAIPAVLWLGFFYLMDRHEPEPKQLVAGVCVLGALIAGPLAGLLGYVMGRAKFSRRSAPIRGIFIMLGLLGAAAFNGQFTLVENWVLQR